MNDHCLIAIDLTKNVFQVKRGVGLTMINYNKWLN